MIYQKRMRIFLSKHSIESLMNGEKREMIAKRQMVERKKQHANYGAKMEALKIIDISEKKAEKRKKIIDSQLDNQEKTLESRISRRKSMSNKSTKTDVEESCEDIFSLKGIPPSCNLVFEGMRERGAKRVFI